MKKYRCVVCEWIYDPAVGDPDGGIVNPFAYDATVLFHLLCLFK